MTACKAELLLGWLQVTLRLGRSPAQLQEHNVRQRSFLNTLSACFVWFVLPFA
jgi:hypothetical protein